MGYDLSDAQLLAQIPTIASSLLIESEPFETLPYPAPTIPHWNNFMNGWIPLEKLTRDSIQERSKIAARRKEEIEQERTKLQALTAKPNFPSRSINSSIRAKAMKALEDPIVLRALREWSRDQNKKSR